MAINLARVNRYQKKLIFLQQNIIRLQEWMEKSPLEKIKKNNDVQSLYSIYHAAQNAIETMIDIIAMINKDLISITQDRLSNLETLLQKKIIPQDLKDGVTELMGLRNRLVHEYNGIIDEFAWEAILENIETLTKFKKEINLWLNRIVNQ